MKLGHTLAVGYFLGCAAVSFLYAVSHQRPSREGMFLTGCAFLAVAIAMAGASGIRALRRLSRTGTRQ